MVPWQLQAMSDRPRCAARHCCLVDYDAQTVGFGYACFVSCIKTGCGRLYEMDWQSLDLGTRSFALCLQLPASSARAGQATREDEALARALQQELDNHSSAGHSDSTAEADLALAQRLQDEAIRESRAPVNVPPSGACTVALVEPACRDTYHEACQRHERVSRWHKSIASN